MNELALFAGAGGGILGGKLLGWRTICAVELDKYARDVLVARQNDKTLEPFPIWDDIQTFDGRPWRGRIDVVSGGFPCQDISAAGKGAGIEGEKSSLWKHMARIVGEIRPRFVFVENSPLLVGRGLSTVLSDLAQMGYDAKWGIVGAHHVAAPHKRDRIWLLAYSNCCDNKSSDVADTEKLFGYGGDNHAPNGVGKGSPSESRNDCGAKDVADAASLYAQGQHSGQRKEQPWRSSWWQAEPCVGRVVDGLAARVDRLRCLGNGQVPAVVALAWSILTRF